MKKVLSLLLIFIICMFSSFAVGYKYGKLKKLNTKSAQDISVNKHFIDIELDKCIESSHVYDYPLCSKKAEEKWDMEIDKNIKLLKEVMSKEDFEYINSMNLDWNKSVLSQINTINKFISGKDGIIYQTIGNDEIANLKKQYAMFLSTLYDNYKEEKEGLGF